MNEEKVCNSCDKRLPLDKFYQRQYVHGPGCSAECRDCRRARSKRRYDSNSKRCKTVIKNWFDTVGRFARYGLTPEQYQTALVKQGGCCALCGAKEPGGKGKWHIDHAHDGNESRRKFRQAESAQFRGLLCASCNISLGHYEKLLDRLSAERISAYLAGPKH